MSAEAKRRSWWGRRHLPQLEYREWEACGHYPWLERAVKTDFYTLLTDWIEAERALACAFS